MEAHIGLGNDQAPSRTPAHVAIMRDERLARLIGKGSERAFVALYHRYHQQLYRYCRSLLRDDSDAQDALQSTFAGAFAALRTGRRDAPLRPWLFRIAHNESISILRRRRPHCELPDGLPAPAAAIDEQAERQERLRHLVADLRALPERQRAALLMRELSGLSHEEIATALATSVGTAKQSIYEARRALAEFEEGRMASCDEICRTISNGDRRALRARRIRSHLRECAACSAFAAAIPARSADLRALAPALPAAATPLLLSRALAASVTRGSGAGSGAGGGAVGAGVAGKATVALSGAKVATTVVIAATATLAATTVLRPHQARTYSHTSRGVHSGPAAEGTAGAVRTQAAGGSASPSLSGAGGRARTARAGASAANVSGGSTTPTSSSARQAKRPNAASPGATGSANARPAPAASFSYAGGSTRAQGPGRGASAGGNPPPWAARGQAQRGRGNSGASRGQAQRTRGNSGAGRRAGASRSNGARGSSSATPPGISVAGQNGANPAGVAKGLVERGSAAGRKRP